MRLAVARHLALHAPTRARERFLELALQLAPDGGRELAVDLITKSVDLVGPVEPLIRRG